MMGGRVNFFPIFTGFLAGAFFSAFLLTFTLRYLPNFLVADHKPVSADAIVILGGDGDGNRLRTGLKLHDDKLAQHLILTAGSSKAWEQVANKLSPAVTLAGRGAIFLEGSTDTRTDAELSMRYCHANNLHKILVVTSPYHTRRTLYVFNDIYTGSGIDVVVISSGEYGRLIPPSGRWWSDRKTMETVWLEFGKILYWELTPFMEFQGEGKN